MEQFDKHEFVSLPLGDSPTLKEMDLYTQVETHDHQVEVLKSLGVVQNIQVSQLDLILILPS